MSPLTPPVSPLLPASLPAHGIPACSMFWSVSQGLLSKLDSKPSAFAVDRLKQLSFRPLLPLPLFSVQFNFLLFHFLFCGAADPAKLPSGPWKVVKKHWKSLETPGDPLAAPTLHFRAPCSNVKLESSCATGGIHSAITSASRGGRRSAKTM